MPCVLSTDFRTTSLGDVNWAATVDVTAYYTAIRTIMDANHRGEWIQRFQTAKVTFNKPHTISYSSSIATVSISHRFRDITTYFPKFKQVT